MPANKSPNPGRNHEADDKVEEETELPLMALLAVIGISLLALFVPVVSG